jgi:hypothetical protein
MPMRVLNWMRAAASSALMMREARLQLRTREVLDTRVDIMAVVLYVTIKTEKVYTRGWSKDVTHNHGRSGCLL